MSTLRETFFWLLDTFRGGKVKSEVKDVQRLLTIGEGSEMYGVGNERLRQLLDHACGTTEFYSPYANSDGIADFPVLNKNIIRDNFKAFLSKEYKLSALQQVVTSGSTGTPFKVLHSSRKKLRNTADTIYFAERAGFKVGDRLLYLKIWAKEKMKSPLTYWLQNLEPVDVIHLDEVQISKIISNMEKSRTSFAILGYVSALELVCRFLEKNYKEKVKTRVSSIITMSESLNSYVKTTLEKYFDAEVFSRYSNLENGIIAQQVPGCDQKFLVNTASYFVEILAPNEDKPVRPGELGRIVVTDLYNYAMPLIRYDTGDIGAFSAEAGLNLYFDKIEGRKLDVLYDTRGGIVSSYIMYKNMWKYTEILQYQLIQRDSKQYLLKVNHDGSFAREENLVKEFKSYLGADADFSVEYVSEIPLLASGKRRKLVNEMVERGIRDKAH
ncbi:hypothetical protein [uncultured Imperialibacter sp.]|uniref:hypothetical protein n=1 Tax=uncultured Imperialibacter sp. TaxID=1672639 RepID=UPI0030D7899D|tara:strand:+ start:29731 stop:31050 length:1320 start_codon:yes stop_codon:yes gene_type:complete